MTDGNLSRRRFMKMSAGATGAAATVGAASSVGYAPVGDAEAVAPIIIGGAIVGSVALGYLTSEAVDHYTGEEDELTGSEETSDLHAELYSRIVSMRAANDSVLTVIQNRKEDSYNVVWPKVKKAAVKALNAGKTETDAKADVAAEVDAYYAQIQTNLINRAVEWNTDFNNILDLHDSDTTLAGTPVIEIVMEYVYGGTLYEGTTFHPVDGATAGTSETLVDGTTYNYNAVKFDGSAVSPTNAQVNVWLKASGIFVEQVGDTDEDHAIRSQEIQPSGSGTIEALWETGLWGPTWDGIVDAHTQMDSNANTYVTNLYQNYTAGDIDPASFLDPVTVASELSTDYDSTGYHAYAAAEAAMLGTSGDSDHSMVIDLVDAGISIEGSIWTDWEPEGAGVPMKVGVTYDPSNTALPVYLSYEYEGPSLIPDSDVWNLDGNGNRVKETGIETQSDLDAVYVDGETYQTGFQTLTERFTIAEATNMATGDSVAEVGLEEKNYQTAEVSLTEEQLQRIAAYRDGLRTNADGWTPFDSSTSGGGGALFGNGFLDFLSVGNIPGAAVGLGGAAAGYLALGGGGSGGLGNLGGSGGSRKR